MHIEYYILFISASQSRDPKSLSKIKFFFGLLVFRGGLYFILYYTQKTQATLISL